MLVRRKFCLSVLTLTVVTSFPQHSASAEDGGDAKARQGQWSLRDVLALSRDEILELWSKCPPPTMEEMNGHYTGLIVDAGNPEAEAAINKSMFNEHSRNGYWLGKAYKQTSATTGEGYNRWRLPGNKIVRIGRFATEMGTSLIDGKPAFMMYYQAFNKNNTLTDEIRKLDDNLYLAIATSQAADGSRTSPGHFILVGPTDSWVGPDEVK